MRRRCLLQAGALGLGGLTWPNLLLANGRGGKSDVPGFGRAKQCIFLFMWGGPSQIDTFDPKPLAAAEVVYWHSDYF